MSNKNMDDMKALIAATEKMTDQLRERRDALIYEHYISKGHYVAGERAYDNTLT